MTDWKEINQEDLDKKLGESSGNGNGGSGSSDSSDAGERKEVKLKRVVKFATKGSYELTNIKVEGIPEGTWLFCGRTGSTSHYNVDLRDHYNQFAIVEIDSAEYMVRWHKQFASSSQYEGKEDNLSKVDIKDWKNVFPKGFAPLAGKSFWIEDIDLINGIKQAKPNVSDQNHEWLFHNIQKEYQHRAGDGNRCLLEEFDLGKPPTISEKKRENSDSNKSSSSDLGNKGGSGTGSILTEEIEEEETKPDENPSKKIRINYKVVNIYKLSDMNKFGKKLFRTKASSGATVGAGLGALVGGFFAVCAAPVTGGTSLFALAPIAAKGALVGTAIGGGAGFVGGKAVGAITGEHENLSQRGGIEFGIGTGWGVTDRAYRAEYTIEEGQSGAKELCGNSIVPYIAKGADKWEDKDKKYGNEAKGEFILNPDPKSASASIPKHYRERHCYFNFKSFDDDFAQYLGITPIDNDSNKYGIKWWVYFTHYVGWRMNVRIGKWEDWLHYESLIKEDYDNSSGLARWIAQGMIMLGTAYTGGRLLAQPAVNAATAAGQAGVDKALTTGIEKATTPYLDKQGDPTGRIFGWKPKDTQRIIDAQESMDAGIAKVKAHYEPRANARMAYTAGRSFAGATRLFGGGKGSYQSGINEFIHNKAQLPPLRIEARASELYLERWKRDMNQRIANWDFYFGDDPELAEKKDFGKVQGTGRKVFANAHGKYQLSENIIFPQASPNPLVNYMTNHPAFIYTKCCGKQPHESTCKRPRLTKDDFYEGFDTKLTETINREGRKEVIEWTTTEEHATTTDNDVTGTFGFVFAWCGSIDDLTNKVPLGSGIGTAGAFVNTVFNGDADKEKGDGKVGNAGCHCSSDINPFKGRQYHQIYWGKTPPSVCGELEFGKGEGYNYLVTRYEKGDKKEECVWTKKPEESWILRYNPAHYNAAGGLTFSKRSTTTETKTHRIERNFNPLNISNTISLTGFCGLEGWGDNPPDSFGGGGGTDISLPHSTASLKEELGGMTVPLPQGLGIGTIMPESIQSMLSTEDININIKMPEMPQAEVISQAQQQQEQIWQHLNIGTGEQNLNTERGGETSTEKAKKEKIGEK